MRSAMITVATAAALAASLLSSTTAAPPTSPDASVNPSGFCPNTACPGYGSVQLGATGFNAMTSLTYASGTDPDTTNITVTTQTTQAGWPNAGSWYAGVYQYAFNVMDTCGNAYTSSGKLDVRCNNPPVVVTPAATQTFTIQYGAEILLNATKSFDYDNGETANLKWYWCLLTRPTSTGGTWTTTTEPVNNYIRTVGSFPGYAFFKPDVNGTYTFSVVVSDGCNFVSAPLTVNVGVTCCPRAATAVPADKSIVWKNAATMEYTSSLTASVNTIFSCLPGDYIRNTTTRTVNTLYKNLYSPVYTDQWGNQDTLDQLTFLGTAATKTGCTWPGAVNFDATVTQDDGSCYCNNTAVNWDVSGTFPFYKRRADPAGTIVPAIKPAVGTLQFGGTGGSTVTAPQPTCTFPKAGSIVNATFNTDFRILTSMGMITQNPLLPRPSTSWDVDLTYVVSNQTWYSVPVNTNVTTYTTDPTAVICTVSVDTAANPATVKVTRGASQPLQQCLGYYTFMLNLPGLGDGCPNSQDWVDFEVVCPNPPTAAILCDVQLLWDGSKFVKATASGAPTDNWDTFDNWVQIDARETPVKSGVTYTLSLTAPNPLTYLGAAALQGAPQTDIKYVGANNISAAFLPTYGGAYTVTLNADDSCNPVSKSTVAVTANCMPLSAQQSVISAVTNPPSAASTVIITPNGTYVTPAPNNQLNANLNYGIRVTSRPLLPFGDRGAFSNSYECFTGWAPGSALPTGTGTLNNGQSPVTVTFGLKGSYNFDVTVLDPCAADVKSFNSITAQCPTGPSIATAYTLPSTQPAVYFGSGASNAWASVQTPAITGTGGSPTQFTWFLTAAPAGFTTFQKYPAGTPTASSVTCTAVAGGAVTAGGSGYLRGVNGADPFAPIIAPSGTANQVSFTPTVPGTYTFTMQAIGACDTQVLTTSVQAVCNQPARFVCAGGYSATTSGCLAGANNNIYTNPNGASTAQSTWNNDEQHYSPAFVNVFADAGGETNSSSDAFWTQIYLTGAPTGSWWNIAYFTQSVTFTFVVPATYSSTILDESNKFATLSTALLNAFNASLVTNGMLGGDYSRVALSVAELQWRLGGATPYASVSAANATGLGVTMLKPLCYVNSWGRSFQATVTFAVLPPAHFRSWGTIATANLNNADAEIRGYARKLLPTLNYQPYNTFYAAFATAATAQAIANGAVTTMAGLSGSMLASGAAAPAFGATAATAPNEFLFSAMLPANANPQDVATSFLPDLAGNGYKFDAKVWDSCQALTPGAVYAQWSVPGSLVNGFSIASTQLTVNVVAPSTCGTLSAGSIVQFVDGNLASPSSVSRTWYNSSTKFGQWSYAATGPTYLSSAAASNPLTLNLPASAVCIDAVTGAAAACAGTFGSGSTITFAVPNAKAAIYAFTLPNSFKSNGATIKFDLSTTSASDGLELRMGCATTTVSYTATTSVYYFYTFNTTTTTATTYNALVPEQCINNLGNSVDIVFSAVNTGANPYTWNIANIVVYTHPSGYINIPASQFIPYQYVLMQGTTPLAMTPPFNVTGGSLQAQNLWQQQFTGANFQRLSVSTFTSAFQFSVMYRFANSFPAWVLATGNTCSGGPTTTQTASLQCPKNNPSFKPAAGVSFNASTTFRYNSASVAIDPASLVAPYTYFALGDMSFTFWVNSAPATSLLNARNLIASILNGKHSYITPAAVSTNSTPSATTYTIIPHTANVQETAQLSSTITTTTWSFIDPATLKLQLKNQLQGAAGWIATPNNNGDYLPYAIAQNGMASFVPDVAGTYTISATLDDGCNPVFNVNPVTVTVTACPAVTLAINMAPFVNPQTYTATITDSGAGRVLLQGVVKGATFLEDSRALNVSWSISPSVPLYDTDSLYPSFIPAQAVPYAVNMTVWFGADCYQSVVQTITVGCGLVHKPSPSVGIAQENAVQRIAQSSLSLTWSKSNAIYWLGEPGCVNNKQMWGPMTYTCPTVTYSVKVVGVWPPVLMAAPTTQIVQFQVSVGGGGIPDGLMALWYDQRSAGGDLDNQAVMLSINGVYCKNPYITNQASGLITCQISGLTSSVTPVKATATLLGVSSAAISADFWVSVLDVPVVTSVTKSSAPTVGGVSVQINGWNLAFDRSQLTINPMWTAMNTTVTIDGQPCTGVSAVAGSFAWGATATSLTCTIPVGYGINLPVVVKTGFWDMKTGMVTVTGASAAANVFSYDAPVVQSLTVQSNTKSTLGGYWLMASIQNFGPKFLYGITPPPMPTMNPSPYSDVWLTLAGTIPLPMWSVVADETAAAGAQVKVWVPRGCGSGLDLRIARRGAISAWPAAVTFSYDAPTVTCVGQPYVDSTQQGCTRIFIEGTNFGAAVNATLMNITFSGTDGSYHGRCDDVQYQSGSEYVRVSCRVPVNASVGDVVMVQNECGQSGVSAPRGGSTLPSSINLAGCGQTYSVEKGDAFSYSINAPMVPAAEPRTVGVQEVVIRQGGKWKEQILTNGLFIGLILPAVLLIVIGYPLYVMMANRGKQASGGGGAWATSSGSSGAGGAGDKTVTKGATRVTMNPVSFAPAPPIKPADAPGAVHDNL